MRLVVHTEARFPTASLGQLTERYLERQLLANRDKEIILTKFYSLNASCAVLCSVLTATSYAADSTSDSKANVMNFRNAAIIGDVHHTHQLEIRLSKLGVETSKNNDLKKMSQDMVADHEKADAELQALAKDKSVKLADFEAADSEKGVMDALKKLTGASFDVAYLDFQRDMHASLAGKLKLLISEEKDPGVKSMMQSILPTVEHHAKMSTNLEAKTRKTL